MAGPDVLFWLGMVASGDTVSDFALVLTDGQLTEIDAFSSTEPTEATVVAFIDKHVSAKMQPVLAGRTLQQDRRLLRRVLPAFDRRVHYRMVDVWTVGELARRWYPDVAAARPGTHASASALDEARESIEELRYYRGQLLTGRDSAST